MFIKIYFDTKLLVLCDSITEEIKEENFVCIDNPSANDITYLLQQINGNSYSTTILKSNNLNDLKQLVFRNFTPIEAAGGIVQNDIGELLFIYRLGKWDLPKGKLEEGESIETCAQREIEEETGTMQLMLKSKIGETYHQYNAYGKEFLKTSHWYYFTCPSNQQNIPQTEENITAIKWILPEDVGIILQNTYPSIKDILEKFSKNYL